MYSINGLDLIEEEVRYGLDGDKYPYHDLLQTFKLAKLPGFTIITVLALRKLLY